MKHGNIVCGIEFARAVTAYFGLPGDQVDADMKIDSGVNDIFGVTMKITLSADDLAGIADRMPGRTPGPAPVPVPAELSPIGQP